MTTLEFKDFTRAENQPEFARLQVEMCQKWADGLHTRGVDIEDYTAQRRAAYDRRWREALNHVRPGSAILDIGGGYLHDSLLQILSGARHDYYEIDIDPAVSAPPGWT